ncbi:MAG: YhgE/Pip domain-containing protein [Clostridiaceae bacterium]|nr:YhgE/Pip domain-containing protein [Clostridiaceae bacterium]
MRNIFKIYKRDLINIFTNSAALIITIALIILPSLYAWFNIKSSWDPYGNTKGIKVAVVNNDIGSYFGDTEYKIGEEIINSLKENDKIGWQFVSMDRAEEGLILGDYYATIEIPKNFSEDLLSFISGNIEYPKLIYRVNQKTNAIAPKITDKGVTSIQDQIGRKVVETVDGIIFEVFNAIGLSISESKGEIKNLIDQIYKINDSFPEIEELINKAYDGTITVEELINRVYKLMPTLKQTLNLSNDVLNKSTSYLDTAKNTLNDFEPVIKEDLILIESIINDFNNILNNINTDINLDQLKESLTNIENRINNSINPTISSLIQLLTSINSGNNPIISDMIIKLQNIQNTLPALIDSINSVINDMNNNLQVTKEKIDKIREITSNVKNVMNQINQNYDSHIVPEINNELGKLNTIVSNGITMINEAQASIPDVEKVLSLLDKGTNLGSDKLGQLKANLPTIKEKINDIVEKVSKVDDEERLDALLGILIGNSTARSNFLSSPIEIEEDNLFNIPNYGSAMSPFYSTLALWVGGLLLVSLLTTGAKPLNEGEELKTYEKYFGKYLTFISIGILQGLIVSLGDIFILGTYVLHPVLFVVSSMLISLVFVTIVFSLVSIFGNVGKAIAIIYLVLQVAASGGTFPVDVMSPFFQKIHPFLPFKYSIGLMREFVAGIVNELLIKNTIYLIGYGMIFVILSVFFKGFINKYTDKLSEKLEESGLAGH